MRPYYLTGFPARAFTAPGAFSAEDLKSARIERALAPSRPPETETTSRSCLKDGKTFARGDLRGRVFRRQAAILPNGIPSSVGGADVRPKSEMSRARQIPTRRQSPPVGRPCVYRLESGPFCACPSDTQSNGTMDVDETR